MCARHAGKLIIACALALAFVPRARAADEPTHKFDGYGFVSGYYDNNVFSYSDQDRQLFESGAPAAGKFPIEGLADFVTTLVLRGGYDWDIRGRSMWRARLLYDGSFYARNAERTNHRFGASLQRLVRRSSTALTVSYTPEFYLRHLYWRPMPERPAGVRYAAARYEKLEVKVDGRTRLARRVDGLIALGFARRNYDFPFDERDNNTYSVESGIEVVHPRLDVSVLLNVHMSRARGADTINPAVEDISDHRFGFEVGGTWRVNPWLRFAQAFDYGHQVYTSSSIVDVAHHDRKDDEFNTSSELRFGSFSGWQPEVFFQYRSSSSTTAPGIAEFGQYDAVRWGTQVTYYF